MTHFSCLSKSIISENGKNKYNNFIEMMDSILCDIENKKCDDNTFKKIDKFKSSLGNEFNDPRYLIRYIFIDLINFYKINTEIVKQNTDFLSSVNYNILGSYKNGFISNNISLDISLRKSYQLLNDINKKDEYNIIIKLAENEYNYSSFLKFYLIEKNKEYILDDCFRYYLNKTNRTSFQTNNSKKNFDKKYFIKFPRNIVILIYYVKEKEIENYYYEFNDILDFSKVDYVDNNIEFKKYFLSSLIVCKFPKKEEKKFFYTYCRKNKDSINCIIYNSKDNDVRETNNIFMLNNLKKRKNESIIKTKSYPYVLVYTSF